MIVIWDNGGAYSNHEIGFFDIGDLSIEEVDEALKLTTREDCKIIAHAEAIEWREQGATSSFVRAFCDPSSLVEKDGHLALSRGVLRALLPGFTQRVAEWDERLAGVIPKGCANRWPGAAQTEREALATIIATCRERFPDEEWKVSP